MNPTTPIQSSHSKAFALVSGNHDNLVPFFPFFFSSSLSRKETCTLLEIRRSLYFAEDANQLRTRFCVDPQLSREVCKNRGDLTN